MTDIEAPAGEKLVPFNDCLSSRLLHYVSSFQAKVLVGAHMNYPGLSIDKGQK